MRERERCREKGEKENERGQHEKIKQIKTAQTMENKKEKGIK